MNRQQLNYELEAMGQSTLLMDGLDEACIGFAQRCGDELVAVYSYDKIIEILMSRDGMDYEDAAEYTSFNILGAWVGDQTPIIVMPFFNI
jgi:hypothetical protein